MASKKDNIKALFKNTRTRLIIIITLVILLIVVIVGVLKFHRAVSNETASSRVSGVPGGILSIPGGVNQTEQYRELQEKQNFEQAQQALAQIKKSSAPVSTIPTMGGSKLFGSGVEPIKAIDTGVGFTALAREDAESAQRSLWTQSLHDSNCAKSEVNRVVAEGATIEDLKKSCSCGQLKEYGYGLKELVSICSCPELKKVGFTAKELKDVSFTAEQLRLCDFIACALRGAAFTAQEMKNGGYSDGEMKGAGYTAKEIAEASGLPAGITEDDVRKAGCNPEGLKKLRAEGVSAAAIRRISGCSIEQLKAAGFSDEDLKNAGFSAAELRKAGVSAADARKAGFAARDLLNAGFTGDDLTKAGYTPGEIADGEAILPPGISPQDVKNAGCDIGALTKERLAGVSAKLIKQYANCEPQLLLSAGFSDKDLENAGFSAKQIAAAKLIPELVNDATIKAAGCEQAKLQNLLKQKVASIRIRNLNNCDAVTLKAAGFDAKSLVGACFSPAQLLAAKMAPEELRQTGMATTAAIAAGRTADCSVESLRAAKASGVSAATIKQTLGCSAAAMRAAGFTAKELRDAGYTPAELKNAGFTAAELKQAGFNARELAAAGFSPKELKDAGFSAKELKDAGFNAKALKAAGFALKDLKDAGFSPKDLKDAGFSAKDLKNAGFNAKDLKNAGFNARDLKDAGFNARDLKDAGFDAQALKDAGLTPKELQNAGFGSDILNKITNGDDAAAKAANAAASSLETANAKRLQDILKQQNQQMDEQRYQQKIQQATSQMVGNANQALQNWRNVAQQTYVAGQYVKKEAKVSMASMQGNTRSGSRQGGVNAAPASSSNQPALIKTGDVLFAVIDTAVNSDEPSPILATIVGGKLRGAKLVGNFNKAADAEKITIVFNTLSVPGAAKSISVNAYAIDPDTARTALASNVDHHYLFRYGSLFASSFLQGFGNAFQSANTTVTIGGTGGGNNFTVQNGIDRSVLENAVIGLATVGKDWGQVAQKQFNTPITIEVYAGTAIGVLFLQDLYSLT